MFQDREKTYKDLPTRKRVKFLQGYSSWKMLCSCVGLVAFNSYFRPQSGLVSLNSAWFRIVVINSDLKFDVGALNSGLKNPNPICNPD